MALLPVADALQRVLAQASPLESERLPLTDAHGRVLADDLRALRTQPPADVSAMDGYAVRAADVQHVPTDLRVIGEVAAGRPFPGTIKTGEAVRIFTGGEVPAGADTIVIQENTDATGRMVIVTALPPPGRHIRTKGIDFSEGDLLLQRRRVLTGRDLGLAAAMNHPHAAGASQGPGRAAGDRRRIGAAGRTARSRPDRLFQRLFRSRRWRGRKMPRSPISASCRTASSRHRGRDPQGARRAMRTCWSRWAAPRSAITTWCRKRSPTKASTLSFWKIAMRPGRPMMHGRLGNMHVLGLPGNPVSAYVCAFLFLVPLMRTLAGRSDIVPQPENALLGSDLPENDERADYLRARLSRSIAGRPGRHAVPAAGFVAHPGARGCRLPGGPRALCGQGAGRFTLRYPEASILGNSRFLSRQIKGLRNTYRTYSVCS